MAAPMRHVLANPVVRFIDHVLRGVSQVMLQNNPLTGFLFLLGIFINAWVPALYALIGTAVATESGLLLGASHDDLSVRLFGMNGMLTGLALAVYLQHSPLLLVYVVVASLFVVIVTAAVQNMFGSRAFVLTGPFVITSWIFLAAVFAYGRMYGAPSFGAARLPTVAAPATMMLSPTDALEGVLNGVAQVMLQRNVWTGLIFLLALAVNSRVSCVAAILGSASGVLVAWALGATPDHIQQGLYGFNAVLAAIAIAGLHFALHRVTVLLAALAVCVSIVLYGSCTAMLGPFGLPVLTAPFVIITWLCLLARGSIPRLRELSLVGADGQKRNPAPAEGAASKNKRDGGRP